MAIDRTSSDWIAQNAALALYGLIESSPDSIFIKDSRLRLILCNTVFARSMGREPDELYGKTDVENGWEQDFVKGNPEKGIRGWERDDLNVLRGMTVQSAQEPANGAGGIRYFDTTKIPLRDPSGEVIGILGIARDVTELVVVSQKLREQGAIVNASDDAIISKTLDGTVVTWNRGAEAIYGYTEGEIVGRNVSILFPPDGQGELTHILESIGRGEKIDHYETVRIRKDGRRINVSVTVSPVLDDRGRIIGASTIARDVTARTRTEEALRQSQGKLEAALASMTDAVFISDMQGQFIDFNDAFVTFHRFNNRAECARKLSDYPAIIDVFMATGEPAPLDMWAVPRALRGETATNVEYGLRRKDTGETWVGSYSFNPIRDKEGTIIGSVVVGRDITERKRAEEEKAKLEAQLQQIQKMEAIGQLTGGVAHDFNNVLQAITGYTELLRRKVPPDSQSFVAEIARATGRAGALTAQLLAFSRKQVLRPRVVDTKELVLSINKMLERVIGEDIELRILIGPQTGNCIADPGQLEQVLLNLAVNARDAMPSGGKLIVETTSRTLGADYVRDHPEASQGRYVCLTVSDTGVGMDRETLAHMYEPFFTTKEIGKGTGLGLSTVYGIVRQSNGYISCYSEVGKGTTFAIYLPESPEKSASLESARQAVDAPRGTETILLADDDASVRTIERIALEDAGYVVIEASDGEQALAAAAGSKATIALLVTDVVMPRMSGKDLSRKLQESFPDVGVLFVSGYTADVISHHGILDSDVDFLQKPFFSFDFLTKVREILDRPGPTVHRN